MPRQFLKMALCKRQTVIAAMNFKSRTKLLLRGYKFSAENGGKNKPKASEVLTSYLKQTYEPPWTSYFVRHADVINDQFGMSHFNWKVGSSNYHILRVGCYPYIKYHCTRRPEQNLDFEDKFFRFIKVINLGIPCLMYGTAAIFLIKHKELVHTENGSIYIYFLLKEDLGAQY